MVNPTQCVSGCLGRCPDIILIAIGVDSGYVLEKRLLRSSQGEAFDFYSYRHER